MPDDNFRPTHGLPPESRPTNTPPAWWALLDRVDLPDSIEEMQSSAGNRWRQEAARGRTRRPRTGRRWHTIVVNLAVLLAAALLIVLGLGVAAPGATAATLLVCGMVALLGLIGVGIARRIGRNW